MSKYLVDSTDMTAIATAIRSKKHTTNTMTVSQMPSEIATIGGTSLDYLEMSLNDTLTSYSIPTTVSSIPESAFYERRHLTTITIPNTVTTIGSNAFNKTGLTSVVLPTTLSKLDWQTFFGCTSLVSVTFPNSMTGNYLERLSGSCFFMCHSLTTLINFNMSNIFGNNRNYFNNNLFRETALEGDIYVSDEASFLDYSFYNSSAANMLYIHLSNDSDDYEVLESSYAFGSNALYTTKCRLVVPYSSDHSILTAYQTAFPSYSSIILEENS